MYKIVRDYAQFCAYITYARLCAYCPYDLFVHVLFANENSLRFKCVHIFVQRLLTLPHAPVTPVRVVIVLSPSFSPSLVAGACTRAVVQFRPPQLPPSLFYGRCK